MRDTVIFSPFLVVELDISNSRFRYFSALRRRSDIVQWKAKELDCLLALAASGEVCRVPRYKAAKLEKFTQFVRDLAALLRNFFTIFFSAPKML